MRPQATGRETWAIAAAWFAAAALLYLLTGARGLIWGDPSKLTLYALAGYLPSLNPGDHAGWTALATGWLRLVGGDPVVAMHRLSALAAALAVAALPAFLLRQGRRQVEAHTAAAVLLVCHPLWSAAGVAETYAPALAAVLLGALAARSGKAGLLLAGVLWGLAAAIHVVALALVVPLAFTVAGRRAPLLLPGAVIGLAPVWLAAWGAPNDPLTGFAAAGAGTWRWHVAAFVAASRAPGNAAMVAALLAYGLGPVGLWAVIRGRGGSRVAPVWWLSFAALALLLLVYAPYRVHLLLTFLVAALLLARPVRLPSVARWSHVAVQVLVYVATPLAMTALGRESLGVRELPHRNNAQYFLNPMRQSQRGVEEYLAEAASCLPAGASLLADFNVGAALVLAQRARAWRPDVVVAPVAVDVALGQRDPTAALVAAARAAFGSGPVAFADTWEPYYRLHEVARELCLERCGPLEVVRDCAPRRSP